MRTARANVKASGRIFTPLDENVLSNGAGRRPVYPTHNLPTEKAEGEIRTPDLLFTKQLL